MSDYESEVSIQFRNGCIPPRKGRIYELAQLLSSSYTIEQISERLRVTARQARKFCLTQSHFTVIKIGRNIMIKKDSFDQWLGAASVYLVSEIADVIGIKLNSMYYICNSSPPFRVVRVGTYFRIPKDSFDCWLDGN